VYYVGRIDPLDKVSADRQTCEAIEVISYLPQGWPYGPVAMAGSTQRTAVDRTSFSTTEDPRLS
jgi:hypothetical protein